MMSPTAASQSETLATPSDEALLAEVTPEMQAKLKADSRQQGMSTGYFLVVMGAFVVPNLATQFGVHGSIVLPSNRLTDWAGLLFVLLIFVLNICGLVTMVRAFIGQPSMLRTELAYRRQYGKWRWER